MRIKNLVATASGKEGYTSAFKSKENISAMVGGHKTYKDAEVAKLQKENPGLSQMEKRVESRKLEGMAFDAKGLIIKISAFALVAANLPKDVLQHGLDNLPATLGAGTLAALTAYEVANHVAPKARALGSLTLAAIRKDRRLDQLTESDNLKAYDQLRKLRLGMSL